MTAFKQVLDIDNINEIFFFPIGNINENEDVGRLMDEIHRIYKRNPVILLPQGRAYDRVEDYCKKDEKCRYVLVCNYGLIGEFFVSLNSLFGLDLSSLNDGTYYFKNHIQSIKDSLSDGTIGNFRTLFSKILSEIGE
mgnify:FL=1